MPGPRITYRWLSLYTGVAFLQVAGCKKNA
jgi:hypothetical protein